eukprot:CAMPEP_0178392528 /NCGR_PEP_ID=MMETSP0689_2-20121128/11724_1 /TAXON_ID=160604 /ORGANISM="Amphidinium massartii, Strain CS-259" /LENGTH=113 /DNA_ID=CAMNT_0020013103 /DNA_START=255 /DNA_END=596 /DNA_ORIENTATION=-
MTCVANDGVPAVARVTQLCRVHDNGILDLTPEDDLSSYDCVTPDVSSCSKCCAFADDGWASDICPWLNTYPISEPHAALPQVNGAAQHLYANAKHQDPFLTAHAGSFCCANDR